MELIHRGGLETAHDPIALIHDVAHHVFLKRKRLFFLFLAKTIGTGVLLTRSQQTGHPCTYALGNHGKHHKRHIIAVVCPFVIVAESIEMWPQMRLP